MLTSLLAHWWLWADAATHPSHGSADGNGRGAPVLDIRGGPDFQGPVEDADMGRQNAPMMAGGGEKIRRRHMGHMYVHV